MRELGTALDAADHPRALALALVAWRENRSPALADLIDVIAARIPRRQQLHHAQWMRAALAPYDPLAVTGLLDTVDRHQVRGPAPAMLRARLGDDPTLARISQGMSVTARPEIPKHYGNRIERLCAVVRWPDDPRTATVFARWFTREFVWDPPHAESPLIVQAILAEQLIRLGDARVLPRIAACIDRPSARTDAARAAQRVRAREVVDAISPGHDDPQIGAWLHALAPPLPDAQPAWDAVAREPDALAPRLVLADRLLERGDPRGEAIALHCANTSIADLLATHWHDWFGDLALVLVRDGCTFERGMLATATFGLAGTPSWVWTAVAQHRELATVKAWHKSQRADLADFVALLALRPALDHVRINTSAFPVYGAARAQWNIRSIALDLTQDFERPLAADHAARSFVQLMRMFPTLEELRLSYYPAPTDLVAALPLLARARTLRRITLPVRWVDDADKEGLRALAARFPVVELDE